MRSCLGVAFVVACGTGAHPATTVGNAAPATPFERADLATFHAGELVLYAAAGDRVTQLATMRVPDADGDTFDWADHDHLFAQAGRGVVMITARGTTLLTVPDEAALDVPRPEGDGIAPGEDVGLVVAAGEAWWSRCAWGYSADGFQCGIYVSGRLWPSPARDVGRLPESVATTRTDAVPAGYAARIADDGMTAACTPPEGPPVTLGSTDSALAIDVHWVSAAPPRLLVIYGVYGYSDAIPVRWSLYGGCSGQVVARGDTVRLGPEALWVTTDGIDDKHERVSVWRGAKMIGELPSASVRFRP